MRSLTILIATAISSAANAKCAMPVYELSGSVSDWSGRPILGAVVSAAWVERREAQGAMIAITDSDGRFAMQLNFNTHTKSSLIRGDVCKGKLTNVAVSTLAPGFRRESKRIQVLGESVIANLSLKATAPDGAAL